MHDKSFHISLKYEIHIHNSSTPYMHDELYINKIHIITMMKKIDQLKFWQPY